MGGVFAGAEVELHVDRAEVEAEGAVVASGDGDELADEDVRVALAGVGGLGEGVVVYLVVSQHAEIASADYRQGVEAEDGLQVDAEVGVVVTLARVVVSSAFPSAG